jgi:hypothetical protein
MPKGAFSPSLNIASSPFCKGRYRGIYPGEFTGNFTLQFDKVIPVWTKSQIASGPSKNAECFRILISNNCFVNFSNRKKDRGGWNGFLLSQE